MSTRFVATTECESHENYKNKIIQAIDEDTIIMSRYLGEPCRVAKNDFALATQEFERTNLSIEELVPYISGVYNKQAAIDGDVENEFMGAGQVSGMINEIISATQVVKQVVEEAGKIVETLSLEKRR
jgi:enoyl-[acyl-carrier protein] reductase II